MPTFTDKHEERQRAKKHMAGAFRIFAKFGFADGASGHISLRSELAEANFNCLRREATTLLIVLYRPVKT